MYAHAPRSLRPLSNLQKSTRIFTRTYPNTAASRYRYFSSAAKMASSSSTSTPSSFTTPSTDPPAHEMKYYPKMTTSLPSKSAEFRRVLHTGLYSQVVLMTIPVGGDIGEEVHTVDQILTFTAGMGLAQVGGREQTVQAGDMVIVPAGTRHQFLNKGSVPLVLYTVYSPAEHAATTVHRTKEEGDAAEEEGRDEPPEWSQRSKAENVKLGLVPEEES